MIKSDFETFRNVSQQIETGLEKRWKFQAIYFLFRNIETYRSYSNQLKQSETDPKMTKSEFETFRNVSQQIETRIEKRWKFQAIYFLFRNIETYRLYRESAETNWNRP